MVFLYRGMRATISGDEGKGFLKLIVAKDTDKLVGAHFVGSEVAEIMQVGTTTTEAAHGQSTVGSNRKSVRASTSWSARTLSPPRSPTSYR